MEQHIYGFKVSNAGNFALSVIEIKQPEKVE